MIMDTTYILPLARIDVDTDLLKAIVEGRVKHRVDFHDLKVSLISIFELQAKGAKLGVPPGDVIKAVDVIFRAFEVIPFYRKDIVENAHKVRKLINDYIDCIVLATAISLDEDLITEDSLILSMKEKIEKKFGIRVFCYRDLVKV
ncbi:MAG: PIN domain-containing protein [Candidatus Baldrarchaeia archaeon]